MTGERTLSILVIALAIVACGSATRQSRGFDRNRITPEQLAGTNIDNLYQAIERLRPEWLNSRGPTSITNATVTLPSVFMNGQLLGKPEMLRDLRVMDFQEIRYWPAGVASARFGMGHPRGVIEITR